VTRHLADAPKGCRFLFVDHHENSKIENLRIGKYENFTDSKMLFFSIYDEK